MLERPGHTEASVDLCRLAGLFPAGAICEIINEDGSMARARQNRVFARRFGLPLMYISDLIAYLKHQQQQQKKEKKKEEEENSKGSSGVSASS